jgi:hypothetical protein
MKRIFLAAALLACASAPFAQTAEAPKVPAVEVPKPKCGTQPQYPTSKVELQGESRRRAFERDLKTYQECMMTFIEERKAIMKANQEAATAAVEEFNGFVKKVNEARAAANQ